jgi:NADH-quinone oxidoreductase subunit E
LDVVAPAPAAAPIAEAPVAETEKEDDAPAPSLDDPARPPALDAAREGGADDLKRISGVGPKIEGILNELGIFHFDQVAAWTDAQKAWVNGYLRFKGRIDREKWLEQAAKLAEEGNG